MTKIFVNNALAGSFGPVRFSGTDPAATTNYNEIWDGSAAYNWLSSSGTALQVSSSSTSDTSAGTGARTLTIEGLSAAGAYQSVTVTLNGRTAVDVTGLWTSIQRAFVASSGSGGINAGDIYLSLDGAALTNGVPDTATEIHGKVRIGLGATTMLMWTVGPDRQMVILGGVFASVSSTITATFGVFWRPDRSSSWQVLFEVPVMFGPFVWLPPIAEIVTAGSDVAVKAKTSSSTLQVTGELYGALK